MKYLLSQEEIDNLVPERDLLIMKKALEWARLRLAPRCPHLPSPEPGSRPYFHCSECPISHIGLATLKQISSPPRGISEVLCPLKREYPK